MKNNKLRVFYGIFASTIACASAQVNADIYLQNAFLYGDNIEAGIGADGAFGSDTPSPDVGRKSYGKRVGYMSDPTGNKFQDAYHGDFFLPGYPEEGWGVGFNGKIYNNNSNKQGSDIVGELSNFLSKTTNQSVIWKGEVEGLEIKQVFRVYKEGTAIVFDVTLKNTTDTAMNDVYYMRTVDPDNNAEQVPTNTATKYITTNTIIGQGSDGDAYSGVSAMQPANSGDSFSFSRSLLTLSGYGENSRVSYGGLFNRDPSEVYEGSSILKHSGSNTADEAISLAFKFDLLDAGDSVTFRAGYQLKDVPVAKLDINGSETGSGYQQLYILNTDAIKLTEADISISGDGFEQLQEAIFTITNPHEGDLLSVLGELPSGIKINATETSDTRIYLEGFASPESYITAIKQIQFSNSNITSSIETRKVLIQLVDDNATPSNSAVSIIDITAPVELNNSPITEDNVINGNEVNAVTLTGHAASNSTITVDFTDKNGKKLSPPITVIADENGNWSLDETPADLSSLSDGLIEVLVTSTDTNGHKSTFVKEILKDTQIILSDIAPADGEVVSSTTPTYKGKTDPNASITLKIMPNGKVYTTTADENGDWSILLGQFALDTTVTTEITVEDEYGNKKTEVQTFKTPSLPIEITDIDANADGMAHSTTPTFLGTSEPNTNIVIDVPTGNGQSISCNTSTNAEGKWSCKLPELPSGGPYTFTVTTTDSDGNSNSISEQISIPVLPLVIDSPVDSAVISGVKPVVSGTSKPGTEITVTVSDGQKCSATTDITNHWSCELPSLSFEQTYTLTVTSTDSIGNSVSDTVDVTTDKLPLAVISPQNNTTAEDTTPTFVGTTTPGTTVTVTLGMGQECSATADLKGKWSCELPEIPVGGPYSVTIKAIDQEGNQALLTENIKIPAIPLVVTSPTQGEVITTNGTTVTGTSDPNLSIKVMGPDGELCETTADADGNWICQLDDLQSGTGKYITVISGDNSNEKKVAIVTINIDNSSEKVKTVLSGSVSLVSIFLLGLFLLLKGFRKRTTNIVRWP